MGEHLDSQIVHDPGRQPSGDLDLEALAERGHQDEDQIGDGHGHHHAKVVVPGRHPVVDGVLGQLRPYLAGNCDDHHQEPR